MPLTSAIQSAMAVRMEREKRHQRRLSKIRRESGVGVGGQGGQSIICTKRQSVASVGTLEEEVVRPPPDKSESMVTTFHLGIVFILLGFIMILSSMIPSSIIKADWSRLLGVGVAFIFIGLIMVMVNRIITAREEEELSKYVAQRLSRTRPSSNKSGQALVRDPEHGPRVQAPNPPPPLAIPSAMKGAGGHPPKSPKEKVTFAEFTDIREDEVKSDGKKAEFSASLDVPTEFNGKVIILESLELEDTKTSDIKSQEEKEACPRGETEDTQEKEACPRGETEDTQETESLLSPNTPD